ncbi:uncharacterized protein LOC114537226 [Dendronephthya gigantea]|uniref:uncharacterized protein LOC114537226 n=1 Tax=Dendronephthya gigantea TaxID=151771 RepID=UPI00106C991C|nr:uncharacterized protein LOC114537226 [Dendronephthya gigantea]
MFCVFFGATIQMTPISLSVSNHRELQRAVKACLCVLVYSNISLLYNSAELRKKCSQWKTFTHGLLQLALASIARRLSWTETSAMNDKEMASSLSKIKYMSSPNQKREKRQEDKENKKKNEEKSDLIGTVF